MLTIKPPGLPYVRVNGRDAVMVNPNATLEKLIRGASHLSHSS